jgi:hypothetical protein
MHISFNLLRIKGLYKFRALLAHLQEVQNKRHLVYLRAYNVSWLWDGCSETATVHHIGFTILVNFTFYL